MLKKYLHKGLLKLIQLPCLVIFSFSLVGFCWIIPTWNIWAAPAENHIDLTLNKEDLIIQESPDGGYHIWIRKKPAINSVLLTESTEDPLKKLHIYALRAATFNPINGHEKRLINGKFLTSNIGILDSTPEPHPELGQAFHLFIPYIVEYGYPGERNGEMQVMVGTFLNIKTFAKAFADWSGARQDNPFIITLAPHLEQIIQPDAPYIEETVKEFAGIAETGGGNAYLIPTNEDLIKKISDVLASEQEESLDLVIALDTTLSMKDELPYLKKELVPLIARHITRFKQFRLGILFYKDYFELYLVKPFPFTDKLETIQNVINQAQPHGGKEIPEAVYEALDSCLDFYPWLAASRVILLVGDAPPHPRPRDNAITKESVSQKAKAKGVVINTFTLSFDL